MKYAYYDEQVFLDRDGNIVGGFILVTDLSKEEYMNIIAERTREEVSTNESCSGS